MKKLLTLLIGILFAVTLSAQHSNNFTYPLYVGQNGTATGSMTLYGTTSGSVQLTVPDIAGTSTIFKLPASNGTSGYVLRTDGTGTLSWISLPGYDSTYIHYRVDSLATIKANLASPTFTGTVTIPTPFTLGDVSVTATGTQLNYVDATSSIQTQFTGKVNVSDTASMLTPYIERKDTASMLTNYILESEIDLAASDTATMLTNYIERKDTASMLTNYILASEIDLSASDTASMLTPYIERKDTTGMLGNYALSSETFSVDDAQDLATIITLQSDTIPKYSYGAGAGLAADSVLFAKGLDGFGVFTPKDTTYIVEFVQQRISTGDSLKFNVYVGVYQTGVAADSMFTAPQATGVNQTTFTPNNTNVILPDQDCWIGLKAAQITAKCPYQWNMQMNGYKRNLSY